MANRELFKSAPTGRSVPETDATNEAGGRAYSLRAKAKLAQFAVTGTFNKTFYADADAQLTAIREAADQCSPDYVAKVAVYAREQAFMKDMPAALMVMLSKADPALFAHLFPRVIDNGIMVRNFVQMVRSGALGRKSLGSGPARLIRQWIGSRDSRALFRASVGNKPSLADVIKLVHPKAISPEEKALHGYIIGKPYDAEALPQIVKDFETLKAGGEAPLPDIDFRQLSSLPLTPAHWTTIALRGGWMQTRMNLNTYLRHGVFKSADATTKIAQKLADPYEIGKARAFPYQLFAAYMNAEAEVPHEVREALQDAMEVAIENVPAFDTQTHVVIDTSGSMRAAVTGQRGGGTSKMTCVDVAALFGSVMLRRNPGSTILPVDTEVHTECVCNPRDSVMTNADKILRFGGGGTDLSAALRHLNAKGATGGLIVMVSDNESWVTRGGSRHHYYGGTSVMEEFRDYQRRNPGAKMVCIDVQPYSTTQAPDAPNEIMNVGGFSDAVFKQIATFLQGGMDPSLWVGEIEKIDLSLPSPSAAG
ncbi:MAG TPA: RNA-binding protein [Thermoleophilia bacterium]|nr:RNA-binding protein [Thermoleophilia bacterium]